MKLEYFFLFLIPCCLLIEPILDRYSKHNKTKRYYRVSNKGLEKLKSLSWQEFELICAGYFQSKGYAVKMTGGGGADNGMDLLIQKGRKNAIVQCKHWKSRVGVSVVREMFGLMHAYNHEEIFIVSLSGFTKDAFAWSKGKPIRLITGNALVKHIDN